MSKAKFPGLQEKLEKLLALKMTSNLSAGQIADLVTRSFNEVSITTDELSDLQVETNLINYLKRAVGRTLHHPGPKKGYQLLSEIAESRVSITEGEGKDGKLKRGKKPSEQTNQEERENWEAFLHLPASIVLERKFEAKVLSLPPKQSNQKWANPDMIMVRENEFKKAFANPEIGRLIQSVDNLPNWVLSSIELKCGPLIRGELLSALAETAINGSWANEKWLVVFDVFEERETELDEDAIDFANDNGIGVLKVRLFREEDDTFAFDSSISIVARPRNHLRVQAGYRDTFLNEKIVSVLNGFEKKFFQDEKNPYCQVINLVNNAKKNLGEQRQFGEDNDLENFVEKKNEESFFPHLCQAIYAEIIDQIGGDFNSAEFEKQSADAISGEKQTTQGVIQVITRVNSKKKQLTSDSSGN